MKIIFVKRHLADLPGGAERALINLANAMAARGHHIIVITNEQEDAAPFFPLDSMVQLINLRSFKSAGKQEAVSASDLAGPPSEKTRVPEETKPALSHWLKLQFPFLRHPYFSKRRSKQILLVESVLRAEAPDLVVAFTPEMAEETGRASRALNIPCILSLRITPESEFSESPGTIRRKLRLARLYDALDCFSGITVQIEDYVKYLPGQYRGLCKVIPNEVELDKFIDTCQKPLITRKKNIVCISGLSARKRVNFLINAFAAVSQRHPEWTLLILVKDLRDRY